MMDFLRERNEANPSRQRVQPTRCTRERGKTTSANRGNRVMNVPYTSVNTSDAANAAYVIQADLDVEQKTVLANGAQAMTGIMDMDDHFYQQPKPRKRAGCGYEELRGYTESAKINNQYMLKKQVL